MSYRLEDPLTGVDLTVSTSHFLYVSPLDRKTTVEYVVLICEAADTVTDEPEVAVTVGGSEVFATRKLYGFTAANKVAVFDAGQGGGVVVQEGESLGISVTGATANSLTAQIDVIGYTHG